jgi:hypothetical protein
MWQLFGQAIRRDLPLPKDVHPSLTHDDGGDWIIALCRQSGEVVGHAWLPEATPAGRAALYELVDRERANQDAQWGGPAHDDTHRLADWLKFIRKQVDAADLDASKGFVARPRLVKVAALAIAAIEAADRLQVWINTFPPVQPEDPKPARPARYDRPPDDMIGVWARPSDRDAWANACVAVTRYCAACLQVFVLPIQKTLPRDPLAPPWTCCENCRLNLVDAEREAAALAKRTAPALGVLDPNPPPIETPRVRVVIHPPTPKEGPPVRTDDDDGWEVYLDEGELILVCGDCTLTTNVSNLGPLPLGVLRDEIVTCSVCGAIAINPGLARRAGGA